MSSYNLKYKKADKFDSYVLLHGHSTYSQGDGVTKINDIVSRANEVNAYAAGLTEHGNMSSFYKFYKEAKSNNLKPIIGCELYLNDLYFEDNEKFLEIKRNKKQTSDDDVGDAGDFSGRASNNHQIAYCKNYEGVKNLIGVSNIGYENFYRKPLVSTDHIFNGLDENNVVTTGCLASKFNQFILYDQYKEALEEIKKWKDRFGDDFYLEIQLNHLKEQQKCNHFYKRVYEKFGIKPVFALDYHYATKDDWYIQYLLYVIKQRQTVNSYPTEDWFYNVRDLYIKEIDEIYKLAENYGIEKDFLELAIDSGFEIADKVNIEMPSYPDNFPKFNQDIKKSETEFMEKLKVKWDEKINNGLVPIDKLPEYKERMKYELGIIKSKGFVDYFLILDDLLNNFVYKVGGATGAGRGSAGGSLVLFILDITKIDPIRHNLIFERFLNPVRVDPADVDLDIDSETQKDCEDYLKEKYGKDKVCHIANFGKFGAKTIVKDLCRIFELDFALSNRLTSYFNDLKSDTPVDVELKKALNIATKKNEHDLIDFINTNWNKLAGLGNRMVGMVRQTGRHASGILVSNKVLNESELPVLRLKGDLVTGVQEGGDEREVSELGYCKLDILGLKTASVINDTFKAIESRYNIENIEQEILKSDFDDKKVYEEFERGNCRDIFQFGSDNMINLIKTIKPKNIVDLSSINAMFRPAIIQAGGIDEYIKNRKDPELAKRKSDSIHPKLWGIWGESFGVPIFQEQIMFILQQIGNFSLAEADKGRKILKLLHKGNQDKNQDFFDMMDKFKKNAMENGVNEDHANDLLSILGKYSEYSFNKSHSLAYAMNAYICMWQKVNYPLEYYSSLLNHSTTADLSWFVKQIKEQGIEFNEFELGMTGNKFEVDYDSNKIRYGLNLVKGLSSNDVIKINSAPLDEISCLEDLVRFVRSKKVSKRTFEPLCKLNYFKNVYGNSKILELVLNETRTLKKKDILEDKIECILKDNEDTLDWEKNDRFGFEKKYFDFYFNEHPFVRFDEILKKKLKNLISELSTPKEANSIKENYGMYVTYGIVNDIILKKSKKSGKAYYKILLEDTEEQIYVTVFNSADIANISKGDPIIMKVSKTRFGFTKTKDTKIEKVAI